MKLLIAGAGGHGRVVAEAALASGVYSSVSFLDDVKAGCTTEGWPIIGVLSELSGISTRVDAFVPGMGDARRRIDLLRQAKSVGIRCASIIHPSAIVSQYSTIDDGTVICAGACVGVGATIGLACIVNTAASVDHDCILQDGVHVCPGANLAGNVFVGARTWFGIGAVAKQGIRIGSDVLIGAGAVVVRNVADGQVMVGNPARPLARSQ